MKVDFYIDLYVHRQWRINTPLRMRVHQSILKKVKIEEDALHWTLPAISSLYPWLSDCHIIPLVLLDVLFPCGIAEMALPGFELDT